MLHRACNTYNGETELLGIGLGGLKIAARARALDAASDAVHES